jgi:hypothetical protein
VCRMMIVGLGYIIMWRVQTKKETIIIVILKKFYVNFIHSTNISLIGDIHPSILGGVTLLFCGVAVKFVSSRSSLSSFAFFSCISSLMSSMYSF